MTQPRTPAQSPQADATSWDAELASRGGRDLTGVTLGDFEVERLLGRGGMGEVYLARQRSLGRPVALKVLRPELLAHPTSMARFRAEARAAARLNHPNVVHIYAFDTVGATSFIAMEYVSGTNLRDYLAKKGPPDLPVALSIMRQAGQAVGAAGEIGLVHRDIKPENLLLTRKGQVKVADFGLCRDQGEDRVHLTQTGMTMGTPQYMSPEQCQGKPLDHRSDLYSLGVTYYHLLAGAPPFSPEGGMLAVAVKHIHEPPPDLGLARPDLPPGLVRLVMRLLAKDPSARYPTAQEMLRDLARIRADGPSSPALTIDAPPPTKAGAEVSAPAPVPGDGGPAAAVAPVRRWAWGVAAVGLGACVAAGALAAYMSRAEDLLAGPATSTPAGPPGLWLDPGWERVAPQPTAEEQYRYAQLRSGASERVAAWLAVAGRFPSPWTVDNGRFSDDHPVQHHWAFQAYVQLARHLLRRGDDEALDALADELEWSHRADDQRLGRVMRAAVMIRRGEVDDAVGLLGEAARGGGPPAPSTKPATPEEGAVLELIFEVAERARRSPKLSGESAAPLDEIRGLLSNALRASLTAASPRKPG